MKVFELVSSYFVDEVGCFNVALKPTDVEIQDKIVANFTFENEASYLAGIDNLKAQTKPFMFASFNALDSVSQEVKNQYTL
jgi:hypothetical protein